jgi:probable rRNA maturation factor
VISRGETIVDVQSACDEPDVPDAENIREWVVSAIIAADAAAIDRSEVSVRVVDVEEMRALNREYRDKDEPTNVLSFPAGEITGLPDDEGRVLGDVVICAAVVRDEAVEQDKALADHWRHMLVHGTLHLLGYDHMTDAEATEMEGLEVRILTSLGVADPYRVQ